MHLLAREKMFDTIRLDATVVKCIAFEKYNMCIKFTAVIIIDKLEAYRKYLSSRKSSRLPITHLS